MTGKYFSAAFVLGMLHLSHGQVTYNQTTDAYSCSTATGAYCGGSSLSTNLIIRCVNFVGPADDCNDKLTAINPVGTKSSAFCYQSSATSGDAVCSFNGVAYPEDGGAAAFPICNTSCIVPAQAIPSQNSTSPSVAFRSGTAARPGSSNLSSTLSVEVLTPAAPETPAGTSTTTTTVGKTASRTTVGTVGYNAGPVTSQATSAPAQANFVVPPRLLPFFGVAALVIG